MFDVVKLYQGAVALAKNKTAQLFALGTVLFAVGFLLSFCNDHKHPVVTPPTTQTEVKVSAPAVNAAVSVASQEASAAAQVKEADAHVSATPNASDSAGSAGADGITQLCRLRQYANDKACQVRGAHTK